jgi:membrane protease YdiL (CAAX protease family)
MIVLFYRYMIFISGLILFSCLGKLAVYIWIALAKVKSFDLATAFTYGNINKWAILWVNTCSSIAGFILWPILYLGYFEKNLYSKYTFSSPDKTKKKFHKVILFCGLFIFLLLFNSLFINCLYAAKVPEIFNKVYINAINRHDELKKLLCYFVDVASIYELVIVIFCLCIVPAVGEELLFRGILQSAEFNNLKNPNNRIFITSLLFAFFHFDVLGFLPRFLLSILLGQAYISFGDLRFPILLHFLNNFLTVVYAYMFYP